MPADTWETVSLGPATRLLSTDPIQHTVLYAAGPGGVYKTTDDAVTWAPILAYGPGVGGEALAPELAKPPGRRYTSMPGTTSWAASIMSWAKTGLQRYMDLLQRQATYIATCQRDPIFGEWYALCAADGTPIDTRKGHEYKAAYHVVQGLYQADRHLEAARAGQHGGGSWADWAL